MVACWSGFMYSIARPLQSGSPDRDNGAPAGLGLGPLSMQSPNPSLHIKDKTYGRKDNLNEPLAHTRL